METLIIIVFIVATGYFSARIVKANKLKSKINPGREKQRTSYKDIVKEIFPAQIEDADFTEIEYSEVKHERAKNRLWEDFKKDFDKISAISALGEGLWYGAEAMDNLFSVDQNVYDALSQLAGKQLDSLSDLSSYLEKWDHDWLGNLTAISNFQGHLAEFTVADHLRELGHVVHFPADSNQAGYDLLVDGHSFNVKDVADMGAITRHFAEHPDIGVISNYDIHGLPENVLHIDPAHSIDQLFLVDHAGVHDHIVDSALSHDAVLDHADGAADALAGNIDFHFPLITAALASYREAKLLFKGNTDILRATKNIGLDVAGTGGGGFLGAKGGAAIGLAIGGPIGAAIGVVIGGVGGAVAGRYATNKIKTKDFENIKSIYIGQVSDIRAKVEQIESFSKKDLELLRESEQKRLCMETETSKNKLHRIKNEIQRRETKSFSLSDEKLKELFLSTKKSLTNELDSILKLISSTSFTSRYLWPTKDYLKLKMIKKIIKKEINDLENAENLIFSQKITQAEKTNLSFEIITSFGYSVESIKDHLVACRNVMEENWQMLGKEIENEKKRIADERMKSFQVIKERIEKLRQTAENELQPLTEQLKNSRDKLIVEMKRLGMEPNFS